MFGGFKATLNLFGGKKTTDHFELAPDLYVTGAYRINREDSYGYTHDVPKSKPIEQPPPLRPVKSTSNLVQPKTAAPNLRNSSPSISRDPRGGEQPDQPSRKALKNQEKEQKKIEKQRLAEQKTREKQAKEQAKQEKLTEKRAQKAKPERKDRKDKRQAPVPVPTQPQPQTSNPIPAQPAYPTNKRQAPVPVPTQPQPQTSNLIPAPPVYNTLDSSTSRSSGPPPYSEMPDKPELGKAKGNVIYSKPVDTGSWDLITQHREQINRPAAVGAEARRKQMVMDLNYNFGATSDNKENSDA